MMTVILQIVDKVLCEQKFWYKVTTKRSENQKRALSRHWRQDVRIKKNEVQFTVLLSFCPKFSQQIERPTCESSLIASYAYSFWRMCWPIDIWQAKIPHDTKIEVVTQIMVRQKVLRKVNATSDALYQTIMRYITAATLRGFVHANLRKEVLWKTSRI